MLKHLTERCVRGNLVFAYAVKTGHAAMIEAVLAQFPADEVGGRGRENWQNEGNEWTIVCLAATGL